MVDEINVLPIDEQATDMLPLSNNGLIDSTQNAIMGAAENVSHVIDAGKAVVQLHLHNEPIYTEVHFWVGVAFILSVLVLLKPAYKFIKAALQRRVERVINDIDEAVKLRDDAQTLLAEYERKFVNVEQEVAEIVAQGTQSLQRLQQSETAQMKADLQNKEKETERRIKSATEKAKNEINLSDELDKFIKAS